MRFIYRNGAAIRNNPWKKAHETHRTQLSPCRTYSQTERVFSQSEVKICYHFTIGKSYVFVLIHFDLYSDISNVILSKSYVVQLLIS